MEWKFMSVCKSVGRQLLGEVSSLSRWLAVECHPKYLCVVLCVRKTSEGLRKMIGI